MTLEIICDFARLLEFQPEWSFFARATNALTPFQLPEWLIAWWRHFGSGRLHVLVLREKGSIAGVIPCFLHQWNGLRQMTLIGSGISDYLEPAIAPQYRSAIVDKLREHLESNFEWDICNWQDLSFDSPLKHIASEIAEDTPCSEILLTGDFEQYWGKRSKSLRQNVRRDRQKAESQGPSRFELLKEADAEAIGALISLHGARWRKHGEAGMIEANHSAAFLEDIAREFAKRGMLRIFLLRFQEKIAAVILAFDYAKHAVQLYDRVRSRNRSTGLRPHAAL